MKRRLKVKIVEVTRRTEMPEKPAVYCRKCEDAAELVTRREASTILQTRDRDLDSMIFDGTIHEIKTVNGTVWICKNSLFVKEEGRDEA